jgi:hypothetical protein
MISLVFLLCLSTGECSTTATDAVFSSEEQCHETALAIIEAGQQAVLNGELIAHRAIYRCVNWGSPA